MSNPFSLSQIINKFLNTRSHKQNSRGVWVPDRVGGEIHINNGSRQILTETKILFESEVPVVIEALEWSVSGPGDIYPTIHVYGGPYTDYNNYLVSTNRNGYYSFMHPVQVSGYGSSLITIRDYDSSTEKYSFSLSRPLYLPTGARVALNTRSSNPIEELESTYTAHHLIVREV